MIPQKKRKSHKIAVVNDSNVNKDSSLLKISSTMSPNTSSYVAKSPDIKQISISTKLNPIVEIPDDVNFDI